VVTATHITLFYALPCMFVLLFSVSHLLSPDVLTIYYNLNQGSTFITTLDCDKLFIWSRWQNPWAKMRSGR
jgi:hypothetical protein